MGPTSKRLRLLVGLGNPGEEYENTYHNVGLQALEHLRPADCRFRPGGRGKFEYCKTRGGVVLVRPLTFMNESGAATAEALKYFRLKPAAMLVLHDDSDLPLGEWRTAFGRGAAGHHGVESIIRALGTKEFGRARIGVRERPGKAGDFVLRRISPANKKKLQSVFGEMEKLMEKDNPLPVGLISDKGRLTD